MIKRALPAMVLFFGFLSWASAQSRDHTDGLVAKPLDALERDAVFSRADVALTRPWGGFPALALADGEPFFFPGTFGWMEPTPDFLPTFEAVQPRRMKRTGSQTVAIAEKDSVAELGRSQRRLFYTRGEVDFVYGKYTGKQGGDFYQSSIVGEIGNDKFHLSVGVFYGEFNGRGPQWRR